MFALFDVYTIRRSVLRKKLATLICCESILIYKKGIRMLHDRNGLLCLLHAFAGYFCDNKLDE